MRSCCCTAQCPACGQCCQVDCGHRRTAAAYGTGSVITKDTTSRSLGAEDVRRIVREELERVRRRELS